MGVSFLSFLVQRKKNKLLRLDEEIKQTKEKLISYKDSDKYRECSGNLQKHLEKEEKDQ